MVLVPGSASFAPIAIKPGMKQRGVVEDAGAGRTADGLLNVIRAQRLKGRSKRFKPMTAWYDTKGGTEVGDRRQIVNTA